MNSLTRVVLPIALVVAVVFGITIVQMYTTEEEPIGGPGEGGKGAPAREPPLRFLTTLRALAGAPETTPKYLWYWNPIAEIGSPGDFTFWCQNRHAVPVSVRVQQTNCQCSGVDLAVVPHDARDDYIVQSAWAGSPFAGISPVLAAVAHGQFSRSLTWLPLQRDIDKYEQVVPPADPTHGPQFALLRLTWTGRGDPGPRRLTAEVFYNLPDAPPMHSTVEVNMMLAPAFDILQRDGLGNWRPARDINFGELRANGDVTHTLYIVSPTRSYLHLSLTADWSDPCISWSEPVQASDEELVHLRNFADESGQRPYKMMQSLFRIDVRIRERVTVDREGKPTLRQLDLGTIERRMTLAAVNGGTWPVTIRGRVVGDLTLLGAVNGERIEFGNSFSPQQDQVREIVVLANRPGLDLTVSQAELTPAFLRVKLDPMPPTTDGRKQWRLRVTIPKDSLHGSLPDQSAVVLRLNGDQGRRVRIPIRGATVDSGGPRL